VSPRLFSLKSQIQEKGASLRGAFPLFCYIFVLFFEKAPLLKGAFFFKRPIAQLLHSKRFMPIIARLTLLHSHCTVSENQRPAITPILFPSSGTDRLGKGIRKKGSTHQ
jgi:hypothetical protein